MYLALSFPYWIGLLKNLFTNILTPQIWRWDFHTVKNSGSESATQQTREQPDIVKILNPRTRRRQLFFSNSLNKKYVISLGLCFTRPIFRFFKIIRFFGLFASTKPPVFSKPEWSGSVTLISRVVDRLNVRSRIRNRLLSKQENDPIFNKNRSGTHLKTFWVVLSHSLQLLKTNFKIKFGVRLCDSVSDHVHTDPDPAYKLNAEPYPGCFLNSSCRKPTKNLQLENGSFVWCQQVPTERLMENNVRDFLITWSVFLFTDAESHWIRIRNTGAQLVCSFAPTSKQKCSCRCKQFINLSVVGFFVVSTIPSYPSPPPPPSSLKILISSPFQLNNIPSRRK